MTANVKNKTRMDFKEKLTIISDDLNYSIITEQEARKRICVLLGVVGRSEQLKAFNDWFQKNGQLYEWGIDESVIDDYLKTILT